MNETLVVDTDVASDLLKRRPRAARFAPIVEGRRLALSFMSVAELYKWTIKRAWKPENVAKLESALRRYVIVPYDAEVAWAWARIVASCERVGRPIAPSDAWIAAAAIRHDIELATRNAKHFEAAEELCGLKLIRMPT